jgi:hypothetical protein
MEKIWLEVNKCFNIRDKPRTGKNLDEDDYNGPHKLDRVIRWMLAYIERERRK